VVTANSTQIQVPTSNKLVVRGSIAATLTGDEKEQAFQTLTLELMKKYGKDIVAFAADIEPRQKISTGLEALDEIIGGGIAAGSLIEIYGGEGVGKTALAMYLLGRMATGVYVDVEHKYSETYARVFDVNPSTPVISPVYMEDIWEQMNEYAAMGVGMIVLDSMAAQVPIKEQQEQDASKVAGVSMVAGFMSKKLMPLLNICYRTGTILVFLNQPRDNINAVRWGEQRHTPGGHAPKHYAMLRVELTRVGYHKYEEKELKQPFGLQMAVTVKKSNVSAPLGVAEIELVYERGFTDDPYQVTTWKKELLEELIDAGKIKAKRAKKGSTLVEPDKPGVTITEEI